MQEQERGRAAGQEASRQFRMELRPKFTAAFAARATTITCRPQKADATTWRSRLTPQTAVRAIISRNAASANPTNVASAPAGPRRRKPT